MTRLLSAGMAKGRGATNLGLPPRPGTQMAAVYALLYERRGALVNHLDLYGVLGLVDHPRRTARLGKVLERLVDEYGCDLRTAREKPRRVVLAGEVCGRGYVDYVAERRQEES